MRTVAEPALGVDVPDSITPRGPLSTPNQGAGHRVRGLELDSSLVTERFPTEVTARSPINGAARPDEPQHTGVELCRVAVEHVVGCPRDGQPIRSRHQLCQAVGHRFDVRR